ncbi:hypothetical protein [Syntrophus aciditrophicus]|uniref:Hypothetical cytosolic protein n=1 Tax=Syntrophus aciditrophicus (strain SB) TaxID=56780 RepID=Q2LX65_SYNAS|nr:hypothetical protein [Syntrophus aciditrophicus]ABC78672.1 hypothetical cytosolic protein [Syntrophus aciditrophicus SB]
MKAKVIPHFFGEVIAEEASRSRGCAVIAQYPGEVHVSAGQHDFSFLYLKNHPIKNRNLQKS